MKESEEKLGVLYVDDEEKALKYFNKAFVGEFPVFTVSSVSEAKKILSVHASEIGVLVTDQRMPEEKGVELLKFARKEYPQIVRILTTAYSDLEDAIEAVNNGEILRYITKPWNIAALKAELRQSMQFFELRRERDELMREKLSAWQRMEGVNRVRDLLMIASGFTLTRGTVGAVKAFIEQMPIRSEEDSGLKSFDTWGMMKNELLRMMEVSSSVIKELSDSADSNDFVAVDFTNVVKESSPDAFSMDQVESVPTIQADPKLIAVMFKNLLSWLEGESVTGALSLTTDGSGKQVRFEATIRGAAWGSVSILNIPSELLSAYLICYHHGGTLKVAKSTNGVFSIVASFCATGANQVESEVSEDWLDSVLNRFENW